MNQNKSNKNKEKKEENYRLVCLNDDNKNLNLIQERQYTNNRISTSKYSLLNFIPKTLFEFFRVVANCYFLLISILQVATPWSPTNKFTTAGPLIIVLAVTMIKQGIEDRKRHEADNLQNNRQCCFINKDGETKTKFWHEISVGDILLIKNKEEIPADIVILASSEEEGRCFVETCNLDGETNLKRKSAVEITGKQIGWRHLNDIPIDEIVHRNKCVQMKGYLEYEQANNRLYNFTGILKLEKNEHKQESEQEKDINNDTKYESSAVGPSNIILRGCSIRSCTYIFGLVIFTGQQTKLMQNARETPSKQSNVYKTVNRCILLIFLTQFFLCLISTLSGWIWSSDSLKFAWYLSQREIKHSIISPIVNFFTFLILYNNLVPISLYVSLDMIKVIQARNIGNDKEMACNNNYAIARTSDLNEELGQVEYIFSDKTGTLTRNIMEFRKCSIAGVAYGYGTTEIGRAAAIARSRFVKKDNIDHTINDKNSKNIEKENRGNNSCDKHINNIDKRSDPIMAQVYYDKNINFNDPRLLENKNKNGTNEEKYAARLIDDFLTLLAVCHTVIPEVDKITNEITYRASSPDEEALVKAAKCLGYNFLTPAPVINLEVSSKMVDGTINMDIKKRKYIVLNVNEFNSTRKRMSVIIYDYQKQKHVLLCKGADNVMLSRSINDKYTGQLIKDLELFAQEGLRTLVMAQKIISEEEYNNFNKKYQEASISLNDREQKLDAVAEEIEQNMEIIGATGIEDKLQEGVPETITSLMEAGIKIWVLTGDKEETAVNIGHACQLLNNNMKLLFINKDNIDELVKQIDYLYNLDIIKNKNTNNINNNLAMICDGKALMHIFPSLDQVLTISQQNLSKELAIKLLFVAKNCKAFIACRVSPAQKADIVHLVKNHGHKTDKLNDNNSNQGFRFKNIFRKTNKYITLAIGDGANDVNMIQSAHVGIGISGKEGVQAVNASDYAINEFRFLKKLLLIHGRSNYQRISKVILYSFYKNIALVVALFLYNFYNGQSGTPLFESFVMAGWNFFLALPIIGIGIFDYDIEDKVAISFPQLYISGQKNEHLNIKKFGLWILNAVFHACICFYLPSMIFLGTVTFKKISNYQAEGLYLFGTVLYTCVFLCMSMKAAWETLAWNIYNVISLVLSFLLFIFFLLIYPRLTFISLDMFDIPIKMIGLYLFWLTIILVPFTAIILDISLKCFFTNKYPTPEIIIKERSVLKRATTKVIDDQMEGKITYASVARLNINEKIVVQSSEDLKKDIENGIKFLKSYSGFVFSTPEKDKNKNVNELITEKVDTFNREANTGNVPKDLSRIFHRTQPLFERRKIETLN